MKRAQRLISICDAVGRKRVLCVWEDEDTADGWEGAHQGAGRVDSCITGVDAVKPFRPAELEETLLRHGFENGWLRSG